MKLEKLVIGKRGQVINTATTVAVSLMVFILIAFAVLLGISSLNPSTFFTAGSAEANQTTNMVNNYTLGLGNFFGQVPTAMKILGVVLILGFLALLIVIVLRFRQSSGTGGGSL